MQDLIPTLDWRTHDFKGFMESVRTAFSTTGFFLLKNHPIDSRLLQKNRKLFETFFKKLSLEERMKYCFPDTDYQNGYTPMQKEKGEFAKEPDYKHFYQLRDSYNDFMYEIPELNSVTSELYNQFNQLYKSLMQIVAVSLGFSSDYFDEELGNSAMRHIHYPAHSVPIVHDDDEEVQQGGNVLGMCASKHTDINDLTLLHAQERGLELLHKNKWIPVLCDPKTIIVNVGDMLWHLTGGFYKSGIHRVVCEPGVERFSSPFFGHRKDESSIIPIFKANPEIFKYKTEGEFLDFRLGQINLKS